MRFGTDFQRQVWRLTAKIPAGRVTTYALLARALGRPRAARAVGNALHKNPDAPKVPCHRVVKSDGFVGGYAFGSSVKSRKLRREGLKIDRQNFIADFLDICYNFKARDK